MYPSFLSGRLILYCLFKRKVREILSEDISRILLDLSSFGPFSLTSLTSCAFVIQSYDWQPAFLCYSIGDLMRKSLFGSIWCRPYRSGCSSYKFEDDMVKDLLPMARLSCHIKTVSPSFASSLSSYTQIIVFGCPIFRVICCKAVRAVLQSDMHIPFCDLCKNYSSKPVQNNYFFTSILPVHSRFFLSWIHPYTRFLLSPANALSVDLPVLSIEESDLIPLVQEKGSRNTI